MSVAPTDVRDIQVTELTSGVRVLTEYMPHVRSVAIGVWIAAGSRQEHHAENGISHFLEHMLFKGTATRSAEDIARSIDSIGGHLDAFTAKELVSYNAKVLDRHLHTAFDVLSDLVLNPMLREEDIEKEKGVILEELKMENDNPEYVVHETFTSHFWKGHALGKPIIGTKKTIGSFDCGMLSAFHRRMYQPPHVLITAAGRLDHDELAKLAEDRFGRLRAVAADGAAESPRVNADIVYKRKRLQQVHLCLGVPSVSVAHERRYASYLLNTVLGGGISSRLFQNIRERQGLAYAVFSELNLFRDTGCLAVYAGAAKDKTRQVTASVLEEFRSLKNQPIPEEELRRAKDHLKGSLMLSLESTSSRMANLARQELYFRRFFTLDELMDAIEAVTAEEIQELASDCFSTERVALTVLGQPDGAPLTRDDLVC